MGTITLVQWDEGEVYSISFNLMFYQWFIDINFLLLLTLLCAYIVCKVGLKELCSKAV
jgi:hypothetical protein